MKLAEGRSEPAAEFAVVGLVGLEPATRPLWATGAAQVRVTQAAHPLETNGHTRKYFGPSHQSAWLAETKLPIRRHTCNRNLASPAGRGPSCAFLG